MKKGDMIFWEFYKKRMLYVRPDESAPGLSIVENTDRTYYTYARTVDLKPITYNNENT